VESDLGTSEVWVQGLDGELEQLFLNLLINAMEATPTCGRIVVSLCRADDSASVDVADSGPGIPPEILERAFDPFVTTKHRGSGLGLAICAGIARAHAADLTAANAPDGGAVFTIRLPLASAGRASVTP